MRVLVVSDIHSNIIALDAVLAEAAGAYDAVWNLGDTIGYGPRPNECMATMQRISTEWIAGNHDLACIGSKKVDINEFNQDARTANIWNGKQLEPQYLTFLDTLPIAIPINPDSHYIVHGSPLDPVWEYLLAPQQAYANWQAIQQQICFIGHSHVQIFIRQKQNKSIDGPLVPTRGEPLQILPGERYFINPGSVGQPRDGDARAAYAILDTDNQHIEFGRVKYDITMTQRQMQEHRLPEMLVRRLQYGR
jgi:diadenosine tetraphosphatase ApaH/serine/threonine PP2A family protein phosphatase